ncbi:hypothetical protein BCU90_20640 [Vibrio lentus]|uniref:hypothetical protein n=1 Tax=Vibrio lentus TaxID=136468 RepID=UPI000C8262BB|nr:hypothetical protein [Vibrio lentus]PME57333.1 hypothetical protein BCV33_11330 [Vibrio lentus]PMG44931.1 hypothetical protein BCU90_20640 [Vibrio lentus]PMG60014.1 hypothetical protein BCU87_17230 [Vibrio lentus]PMH08706.1 hypothetical protein BCU76_05010 [Vibrio lentus]PMK92808.1 hypothetical protein BCT89_20155 [Vibrio lentus]
MPKYKFELILDVDESRVAHNDSKETHENVDVAGYVFMSKKDTELARSVVIDNIWQSMAKEDLDYLLRLSMSSRRIELGLREIQE